MTFEIIPGVGECEIVVRWSDRNYEAFEERIRFLHTDRNNKADLIIAVVEESGDEARPIAISYGRGGFQLPPVNVE